MSVTAQEPTAISQKKIGWLGIAAIVTGIFLSLVRAVVYLNSLDSAAVLGYASSGIIVALLIAYAIAGRVAKRNWDKFGFWFAGFSLLFLLPELGRKYLLP